MGDNEEIQKDTTFPRRAFLLSTAALLAGATFSACQSKLSKPESSEQTQPTLESIVKGQTNVADSEIAPTEQVFNAELIGETLIRMAEITENGWRYKSAIQSPHFQTDRDVGASGVGIGFLALAEKRANDPKWIGASESIATWLLSVAKSNDNKTIFWSDFVDDTDISESYYSSFDDGTLGVGDYFWRLYEVTGNTIYRETAEKSLWWLFEHVENVGTTDEPMYRWLYDVNDSESGYITGMGMGSVGIVHTLTDYYERFQNSDPQMAQMCLSYIKGSLRYLDHVREGLGNNTGDRRALPETAVIGYDGDTAMNSGYLSGSAGLAFMYLKLYATFNDEGYLTKAEEVFSWLEDETTGPLVRPNEDSVAWKLMIDPQGGHNSTLATGIEEGAAGIGWVYAQAYKITGKEHYLDVARKAGNWLSDVAEVDSFGGLSWHEDESPQNPIVHSNLNNGTAGIGMFMQTLAELTGDQKYRALAQSAKLSLEKSAIRSGDDKIFWKDNDGEDNYQADPSWHWGNAGILAFFARMEGAQLDMPGSQSGL